MSETERHNPVVHFEMPYADQDRMTNFYEAAFGWQMLPMGAEMDNYVLAHTTETGEDQIPTEPGAINGGFFPAGGDQPQHPAVVVQVADIDQAIADILAAGGEVLGEPVEMPGVGRYAAFVDTEGNRSSLLEPASE